MGEEWKAKHCCPQCGSNNIEICETVRHWYKADEINGQDGDYQCGEPMDQYDECIDVSFLCASCRQTITDMDDFVEKSLDNEDEGE